MLDVSTFAARLRVAAEWIEEHPEFGVYSVEARPGEVKVGNYSVTNAEALGELVRTIGGRWDKGADETFFRARHKIAEGVVAEIAAWRKDVCERVVVGQREVEVTEPDPEAVAALPKVTQTKVIEDVEWRCPQLLAPAKQAA